MLERWTQRIYQEIRIIHWMNMNAKHWPRAM